jgi:hypothetical protein
MQGTRFGLYVRYPFWSSCKVPVLVFMQGTRYSVRFQWRFNFIDRFSKNTQISNFMRISPVGAELFHAGGWTDGQTERHDEINSRFSQFYEGAWKRLGPHSLFTWFLWCLQSTTTTSLYNLYNGSKLLSLRGTNWIFMFILKGIMKNF